MQQQRPTADVVLARLKEERRARLRIYIGAAPGVGKTHEMLQEAHTLRARGLDVVVGFVETYGREATAAQMRDLEIAGLVPERVMVAMSSYGAAPRVIRTGARIAGRLGARWYAVYVETRQERPGSIAHDDLDTLNQNISLAERLGATVVRVKADKASDGLIAFARRAGITHVIFGQSQRSRLEIWWRGSVIDRFLREIRDAAVQVVPVGS